MEPVSSNNQSKTCGQVIGSGCVSWEGPSLPGCIDVCKGATVTDVVYKEAQLLCNLITDLNTLENTPAPTVDFTQLNLGCLWTPTVTVWICPVGQTFVPDTSASNGAGYCQICNPSCTLTTATPIATTVPNPVAKPNTLLGVLQLIINKTPCCDPCGVKYCCDGAYTWISPSATGNPVLYPIGACSQDGTPSTIVPGVVPYKC